MTPSDSAIAVGPDTVVALRYKLFDEDSQVLDQTEDEAVLYLHGHDNIVDGLEAGLLGRKVGDELEVTVPPEVGYGERDEGATEKIEREHFPDDVELEPGMPLGAEGPDGQNLTVWVLAIEEDGVTVDLNHPLAGKTLRFEVVIEDVRAATADELEAGHPLQE